MAKDPDYFKKWYARNRVDYLAKVKVWQAAHPEVARRAAHKHHLKVTFGITPEHYEDLLRRQGGGCGICGRSPTDRRLGVDHDHKTNRIRGLLCNPCNSALGLLQDDLVNLEAAKIYLIAHNSGH